MGCEKTDYRESENLEKKESVKAPISESDHNETEREGRLWVSQTGIKFGDNDSTVG